MSLLSQSLTRSRLLYAILPHQCVHAPESSPSQVCPSVRFSLSRTKSPFLAAFNSHFSCEQGRESKSKIQHVFQLCSVSLPSSLSYSCISISLRLRTNVIQRGGISITILLSGGSSPDIIFHENIDIFLRLYSRVETQIFVCF